MNAEDDFKPGDLEGDAEPAEPEDEAFEADDDDVRPDGRSDANDPWHGLNDFDE